MQIMKFWKHKFGYKYVYIYRLMQSTGKRVAGSMTSLVHFEIKPLDPH